MRSRNSNLRPRPTYPGVAILRGFESVGPDRPTRRAERGEEILGRNEVGLTISALRRIFGTGRPQLPRTLTVVDDYKVHKMELV